MTRASCLFLALVFLGTALEPRAMFIRKSSSSPGDRPKRDVSVQGLTEAEKSNILARHDMHRGDVSPPASNMVQLQWDDEIAKDAQEWADNCVFQHNTKEDRETDKWVWVGQNLASGYGYTIYDFIDSWVDEKADYTYENNSCETSKVCGHYTQVVWAKSNFVGCGWADCVTFDYLVCNYGPGGNFNGELPYESGTSCSNCPYGNQGGCSNNLCQITPVTENPTTYRPTTGGDTTTDNPTEHPSTTVEETTTDKRTTYQASTVDYTTTYRPTSDEVQTTEELQSTPSVPCGNDKCDPWTQECDLSGMKCVCRFGSDFFNPEQCPDPCFERCDRSTQICVETDQGFECQNKQGYQYAD